MDIKLSELFTRILNGKRPLVVITSTNATKYIQLIHEIMKVIFQKTFDNNVKVEEVTGRNVGIKTKKIFKKFGLYNL